MLSAITVEGLAEATGKKPPPAPAYHYPEPKFADPKLPVSALAFKDPLQFWEILAGAMAENPPPEAEAKALLPLFKPIGIGAAEPFDRAKLAAPTVEALSKVASEVGTLFAALPNGSYRNGWVVPAPSIGDFGTDYNNRAITARNGLTANTPREAIYIGGLVDNHGDRLSGANRYSVTFRSPPPTVPPGFWSLTLYDRANNYTVSNPLNRYCLGSDNKLTANPDGSVTIYVQEDDPGEAKQANWLPAPAGDFYLILRAYAPGEALLKSQTEPDAYPLPPIMKVDASKNLAEAGRF